MKFKKHKLLLTLCLFLSLSLSFSCNTTEPQTNKKIILEAEDASSTEAWLNLKLENISLPTKIKLEQNDSTIIVTNINSSDTTLFVENLLPNQTYSFNLTIEQLNNGAIKSNKISVTTMDTTSHNFTWETFEIGDRGMLRDVAIINENNIWAVGEIYVNDSTGQPESTASGFAQWDGNDWIITRKEAIGPTGLKSNLRPHGIIAFSENDIWFAHGGVFHWDGEEVKPYWINQFPGNPSPILEDGQLISKLWGTSSSNLYAIGNNGALAYFNGSTWKKISSSTEVDLLDVWGTEDGSVVWACGYDINYRATILKIENGICEITYESIERIGYPIADKISGRTKSVWGMKNDNFKFLTSYGVYLFNGDKNGLAKLQYDIGIDNWGDATKIRGSDYNDIYLSGTEGRAWHYNGFSWQMLQLPQNSSDEFFSLSTKEGFSVFVGERYNSGIDYKGLIVFTKNQ